MDYYEQDLALVHARGFGQHADSCAPGILELLAPEVFVRDITTFVPDGAGAWRRGHERHENVLVDTSLIPALLGSHGVAARVRSSFGAEELPPGLRTVTGVRS